MSKNRRYHIFYCVILFVACFWIIPFSVSADYCSPTDPTCNNPSPSSGTTTAQTYDECIEICNRNTSNTNLQSCYSSCENLRDPDDYETIDNSNDVYIDDTGEKAEACLRANCEKDANGDPIRDRCNVSGYETCYAKANAKDESTTTASCGTDIEIDAKIPQFVSNIYNLLKMITPIALIVFGMLDFAKATTAQDEAAISKAGKKFIQRLIAGVAVFLVFTIVQFSAELLSNAGAGSIMECANCLLNNKCSKS